MNYAGPGQINALTPKFPGTYNLAVQNGSATTSTKLTTLSDSIGVYANNHLGATINQNGTIHWYDNPAKSGDIVSVYANGGGPVTSTQDLGTYTLYNTAMPTVTVSTPGGTFPVTVTYAGKHPLYEGLWQYNIRLPSNLPTGAVKVHFALNGNTDDTELLIAPDNNVVGGVITNPGIMSDGVIRKQSSFTATSTSDLGSNAFLISDNGNYVATALGKTTLSLIGNGVWENYTDTMTVNAPTILPNIPGFPHIVYNDVKGDYNRDTRVWTNTSYYDPLFLQWRGTPGGGQVTLFDMVHYLATNEQNPACMEIVNMWER
jgi:uncharacterized protein (TIGR03437 family)